MYFSDYPQICHDLDVTEEDIAPEDFIKGWYSFDWDHDEIATEQEFIHWATKVSDFYGWMTPYEVKKNVYDLMDVDSTGQITFQQGIDLFHYVDDGMS